MSEAKVNPNESAAGFTDNLDEVIETAVPENAPKKRGRKPGSQGVRQDASIGQIRTSLESIVGMITAGLYFSGKPTLQADGQVIAQHSKNLVDSIVNLCKQDKNVRTFFLQLSQSSAYGTVVVAALPIIIGILANHGLIPPLFGTPVPSTPNGVEYAQTIPNGN